jgi:SpoIID/LytB domain protein
VEAYLLGVVSAEMGRRSPTELAALRAQVVVARTYALRNLRRWEVQGFDLYATVVDEVYGGAGAETPEGLDAVGATRGQILTYDGGPIDACFFSTCGGRTADGTEIFRGADRPYLQSFADTDDDDTPTVASRRVSAGGRSGPARSCAPRSSAPSRLSWVYRAAMCARWMTSG